MAERTGNILDSIEHSNKMEHRAETQVTDIFRNSCICPDKSEKSKYAGMQENRANGAKQSHEVHQGTAISWNTYDTYKSICIPLGVFAQTQGIKEISNITPQVVSDYLVKVVDCGVKTSTFEKICSGIEKLCTCINEQNGGDGQDFHKVIDDYKAVAIEALPRPDFETRAFADPQAIIDCLPDKMQIAAELQYTCGLRISDACHFSPDMIKDGSLTVNSKNGQEHTVRPTPQLMERIQAVVKAEGQFSVNRSSYAYQISKACEMTGQEGSSHSFRHAFAQDRMAYWTGLGLSYQEALQLVSEEMGHHRPEITEWYLR